MTDKRWTDTRWNESEENRAAADQPGFERNRRQMLKSAVMLTVAASIPASVIGATRDYRLLNKVTVPSEVTMSLSDGQTLKLVRSGEKIWYGQVLDKYGRVTSKVASGNFKLKTGGELRLDRYGKVYYGAVAETDGTMGFLECIDPPDCGG